MNAQRDLFPRRTPIRRVETPAARATDPQSSHAAADLVTLTGTRHNHMGLVIDAVRRFPGLTSAELTPHTGLERHEVARRTSDAETAGAIVKGELRKCSLSGRLAVVWRPAHS